MLRKSAIVACVTMFFSYGAPFQISCILLILVASLVTDFSVNPHASILVMKLERSSIIIQLISFIMAGFNRSKTISDVAIELIFFLLNLGFVIHFIHSLWSIEDSHDARCAGFLSGLCQRKKK